MAKNPGKEGTAKQLKWHEQCLLFVLAFCLRLWMRTLRFECSGPTEAFKAREAEPSILILWHNRLFAAIEFTRRHLRHRKISALISASGDGAWLASLLAKMGFESVRGSRNRRGAQSVRDLIACLQSGRDIAITPDGSQGPMYDMKPGAVAVAAKTGVPIVLMSFNFTRAWRLKTWDHFYLPYPFSKVTAEFAFPDMDELRACENTDERVVVIKKQMDGVTVDPLKV
ncbi:lysophospholipid acyltransferase family protein [Coraliomargarita parva]|uniref:lysophospholipid acyltransferase family protein n=1 Tax=Coraliomargarita parva TaxID=3014050 RepID=UPI0022B3DD1F|nr:lysophospholipid acyltransferase family protein [Coraliomargarita parva]